MKFLVEVTGCTDDQARQVMEERLGPEEDYGFSYRIECSPLPDMERTNEAAG